MTAAATTLDSKYDAQEGSVILTGVQALVRLPLERARLDRAAGLRTGGYISGYRGSPLGTYDMQLAAARARLEALDIVARPAINEDLAATAIWGSQQVGLNPGARFDGVFGIWYGKAPGVDRTGDAFKHANFAGVAPKGGVLAVAGDDHGAKSSSLAGQSEYGFVDAEMPVFAPSSVEEVLTFGVKAIDVSRAAGLWVAMVTVAEVMDSAATLDLNPDAYRFQLPADLVAPADGLYIRTPDTPMAQEFRHREFRLPAALAAVRANGFDRLVFDPPGATLGVLACGKAFANVMQALTDLGIDAAEARRLGLRLYKPGLVWPLEPVGARRFATGLADVLVVEERRDLVEAQLKQVCYGAAKAPRIVGKHDAEGRKLIPATGELSTDQVVSALLRWIPEPRWSDRMRRRAAEQAAADAPTAPALHERTPFFCAGCPHNTSTQLPDGSRGLAGIGCHYLVQTMPRRTQTFTQMGGEGISWVGAAPFTDERHVFVNLGDGTYFHSGTLAIRQAVAAGVNITYKILFNDAVAMTGGQPVDGALTPARVVQQLAAEGVAEIVVLSDDPARTRATGTFAAGVVVRPREDLESVQRDLRERAGVTAIVYDQVCATELRRRRKRGLAVDPGVRPYINPRVCEGCGDCSRASNCVAIEPLETNDGRKRRVDLSACNADLSCVGGFCPSFVMVRGKPRRARLALPDGLADLPPAQVPPLGAAPFNVVLAGVGGQGVTSLAAILAMAAHLDGGAAKSVDMLGMAQKGGGVFVHLRLAAAPEAIPGARIGRGQADLLIANDVVVAHGADVAPLLSPSRSTVVLNSALTPTSAFTYDADLAYDVDGMRGVIAQRAKALRLVAAQRHAEALLGDTIFASMILLGEAWQAGRLPVSLASIERAIELNGAAIEQNKRAFALGRLSAVHPERLGAQPAGTETTEALIARLKADLAVYQDRAYAARFAAAIGRVRALEHSLAPGSDRLAPEAARSLHRLMAYKDEYEVARLYAEPDFRRGLDAQFEPGATLKLSLAPPILARKDPRTGTPRKRQFGPWILAAMPLLARFKVLRGTPLDPFGHTEERRLERSLRDAFLGLLDRLCEGELGADLDRLAAIVRAPQQVKGFGHVKLAAAARYRSELERLLGALAPARAADATPAGAPGRWERARELAS